MLNHYSGHLESFPKEEKQHWADYLNSWQDPKTGYFLGPELVHNGLQSRKHSFEHIAQHLAVHVLPALNLLGEKPEYPLHFAHKFLDPKNLWNWLKQRDWRDAWLEGNNLLFVGQLLIFLRDQEKLPEAQYALDTYFKFLDENVDPKTGLWGTNGFTSNANGLYGGYHQLLVYYYENHPIQHPERLVDIALSLQHTDGGFHPEGGGGACEDIDAIDILVNLYKRYDYRRPQIRLALRRAIKHILRMRMDDGGFVYRLDKPFSHMGIRRTATEPNQSNMFPTWFRIHTLAIISEVLTDEPIAKGYWRFNDVCSMGWHRAWDKNVHRITPWERFEEFSVMIFSKGKDLVSRPVRVLRQLFSRVNNWMMNSSHEK
jgi:hypothetical protein